MQGNFLSQILFQLFSIVSQIAYDISQTSMSHCYKLICSLIDIFNHISVSVSVNREQDDSKSRLPVPGSVLDMFTEEDEDPLTDDSMQHGGRIRSFKHERGNWATYVYFPCKRLIFRAAYIHTHNVFVLKDCLLSVLTSCHFFLFPSLDIPEEGFLELLDEMTEVAASHSFSLTHTDEFHLSLSKTVVLRHHWIQPFIQSLRTGLTHSRRSAILLSTPSYYVQSLCLCGSGVTILCYILVRGCMSPEVRRQQTNTMLNSLDEVK